MALGFVQVAAVSGFSTTSYTVPISTPTQNNLLVSTMFTRGTAAINPTGFTTAIEVVNSTEDDRERITYKIAGVAEPGPVWSGLDTGDGAGTCADCYEFSGNDTVSPLDRTASTGRTATVTSVASGTTSALLDPDEVCVAACAHRGLVNVSTMSNNYTQGTDINDGAPTGMCGLQSGYRIVASNSAQSTTFSWNNADTVMAAIATFKLERLKEIGPPARRKPRQGGLVMDLNLKEWW